VKKVKIKIATRDNRGNISDIFYKHPVDHIAIINSIKGTFRGDHYHKLTTQHIYMTKGKLRYYYRRVNDDNSKVKSLVVKEGEMVTTEPNEVHALEIIENNQFIAFSEGKRGGDDYESDTYRVYPSIMKKYRKIHPNRSAGRPKSK
jgi:dTDP-4-dehydrorhamnose 3,5-epimerase-like enzyme